MAISNQALEAAYASAFPGGKNTKGQPIDKRGFFDYWRNKPETELRDKLRADTTTSGVYADWRGKQAQPAAQTIQTPQSYDEWLKGIGSEHAGAFSPETIGADYDPYYQKQMGGLDYQRGQALSDRDLALSRMEENKRLASQEYGIGRERTTENIGIGANEAGLYGSGIYQKELGQQLGDLQRQYEGQWGANSTYSRGVEDIGKSYEDQWGAGEYTPYSLRKFDIEQGKEQYIAGEGINREQQAYDQYLRQFQQGGQYYNY